ncbi:hypothetical protein BCR44DRAFT_1427007 [Catenaria anguillulae PL171]|uniref:NTF2 domain-containing protein n=1 Tax=Catenaria anguillulae PL171 TaxID=765915 RepID=A0A1Y2HYV2_9FUNG|nr:hypothetical protein BCR44DRAFT_1427007 [Catenaria anguillulae PL171]
MSKRSHAESSSDHFDSESQAFAAESRTPFKRQVSARQYPAAAAAPPPPHPTRCRQGLHRLLLCHFGSNRAGLRPLYREHSMMSYEGTDLAGVNAIMEKLESLPFQEIRFNVLTVDAQPSNPTAGSLLIVVTGQLIPGGEDKPLFFTQTFQLIPEAGSWWVFKTCSLLLGQSAA